MTRTPPLNPKSTLAIRGVCAVEIMLGHLGLATGSFALYPNRKAGMLIVGIFFALSGYGLRYSMDRKPDYIRRFLPRRLLKVFLPAYFVYLFSCILQGLPNAFTGFSFHLLVDPAGIFSQINWYVWELMLFYILFYLAYRFLPPPVARKVLFGCSLLFVFALWLGHLGGMWYYCTLCFWAGLWYFDHQDRFRLAAQLHFVPSVLLGLSVTAVCSVLYFIGGEGSFLGGVLGRSLASLAFSGVFLLVCHRFQFGNPVTHWLGRYSYEIFLLHPAYIAFFSGSINSPLLLCCAVIAATLLSAFVLHGVLNRLYRAVPEMPAS